MKMKKQLVISLTMTAAMAMLTVGCQKEEVAVILKAKIQQFSTSGTNSNADPYTPCWHNGDRVQINNGVYSAMAASGSSAWIENVTPAKAYRAIYPSGICAASGDICDMSCIAVNLPSTQTYEIVDGQQRVVMPMGARITTGETLQFHNLCAMVRVKVHNTMGTALSLSRLALWTETASLSGDGHATVIGEETDSIKLDKTASHGVALQFTDGCPATVAPQATASFYIMVPGFASDNLTLVLTTNDGKYCSAVVTGMSLSRNSMASVTMEVDMLSDASVAELIDGPSFNKAIPKKAKVVVFECNSGVATGKLLSTPSSPLPIYGNLEDSVWRVSTLAQMINANPDCSKMFESGLQKWLSRIEFNGVFNTSNVTNMRYMFGECSRLGSLDVSNFNTTNVTNMCLMFDGCRCLTSLDLSNFNTSNVTDMSCMFDGCRCLTSLDLSNFNTENVTRMEGMFRGCSSLNSLNISNFNTENVTNMSYMFEGCSNFTSLNLSNFNTENVTQMEGMFMGCRSLASLDLSNFSTQSAYGMSEIFRNCSSLTSLDLSGFNTMYVTSMNYMFAGCSSLTSLDLSGFNTMYATSMNYMFAGCSSLTNLDLSSFNTMYTTSMNFMFDSCVSLTSLDLSSFNTQNAIEMDGMFRRCCSLTSLDLSDFNTLNAHSMCGMFDSCISLTSLDLSSFSTPSVSFMNNMFANCINLTSLDLSHFDMSHLYRGGGGGEIRKGPRKGIPGKSGMCTNLSIASHQCTITCPPAVKTEMEHDADLPTSGVTFTWVSPTSK